MNKKDFKFLKVNSEDLKKKIETLMKVNKSKRNEYKIRYLLNLLEKTINKMENTINNMY
jgi:hypothetical protein